MFEVLYLIYLLKEKLQNLIQYNYFAKSMLWKILSNDAFASNIVYHYLYWRKIKKIIQEREKFPNAVIIEPTNICNANCKMCPRQDMTRNLGIMSFKLFRKIVDECAKNDVSRLELSFYGEPLIDPLLEEKIRYAKSNHIGKVDLFTNASLMNENRSRKLIFSGIDQIIVSFDGATKKTYETIRQDLVFENVIDNLLKFIELKENLGLNEPEICVHMVLLKENYREVDDFLSMCKELKVSGSIVGAHDWGGRIDNAQFSMTKAIWPCKSLWTDFVILWDGRVALCCNDFDGEQILGDVRKESITSIWRSAKLKKYRMLHLDGKAGLIPFCAKCTMVNSMSMQWWIN